MSESQTERLTEEELEEYRSTAGAEIKTANVSSEDHALRQTLGTDDSDKERIYDAKIAGERFVQFYDDSAAAIREYLSNAETACIRRARQELLDAGIDDVPSNIAELLDMASRIADYEPIVEVTYRERPEATRLTVEDNGIGISVDEYQVVQRIGYSTSHGDGERLGQFGMGWMSGFQLTSIHGWFTMSTRSYLTGEAYSTQEFVGNCEYLDYQPDDYGTTFEFPSFGEAGKEIDIPEKVAEFSEGMRVPVLYRHFDSSGQETSQSDDYLPRNMESDYSDDALVVTFENEFFKAVMSPSNPEGRRSDDLLTYNVTMPIRRNLDSWKDNNSFESPWKWDFRGKREDGPIVSCESDESLVGKSPVENTKYDNMPKEQQRKHVPMSSVPDDAIVMPGPASSRDSYMSGHDDFWKYVSRCLNDAWADIAAERFEDLDTWSDFEQMDRSDKEALFRAYSQFGPSYSENDPSNIQETLEDSFGVTLSTDVCERLDKSRSTVRVVPRGSNNASRLTPAKQNKMKIWQLIDRSPDGVYMGKSISQKKAEIAWGLGQTSVVRINPSDGQSTKERYAELEDLWSFDKLKDLPSTKLAEKLPELDSDVAEKWETMSVEESRQSDSDSDSSKRTSRDPTTKRIDIRVGKRSRRKFSNVRVDRVENRLSNDKKISAGRYSCHKLLLYDQTKMGGSVAPTGKADRNAGIAVTAVPKYVYRYLKDVDNVYTDYNELRTEIVKEAKDELDTASVLLVTGSSINEKYGDSPDELADLLNEFCDAGIDSDVDVFSQNELSDYQVIERHDFDADRIIAVNAGYKSRRVRDESMSLDMLDIMFDQEVPDMSTDAPEFRQVFGRKRHLDPNSDKVERGIAMVKAMGGVFPSQQS